MDRNQVFRSDCTVQLDATTVQSLVASAGLRLDLKSALRLVPFVESALNADAKLAGLDMGETGAAGPPWGQDSVHD